MRLFLIFAAAAPLFAQTFCPSGTNPSTSQPFNIPAYSSTGQIWVFADDGCTWTYSTDSPSWITLTSALPKGIGSGEGAFYWSAAANIGPPCAKPRSA